MSMMKEIAMDNLATLAGLTLAISIVVATIRSIYPLSQLLERVAALCVALVISALVHIYTADVRNVLSWVVVVLNALMAYLAAYGLNSEITVTLTRWRAFRAKS